MGVPQATPSARRAGADPHGAAVSVIIPTLRERENLSLLIPRVCTTLQDAGFAVQVIVVDDDSQDGTVELIQELSVRHPVRLEVRIGRRGLSSAVVEGLALADHPIVVVMDADLSHPPEMLAAMVRPLIENRADFVLGSRYVPGARIEGWTPFRWANSLVATLLALPIARVRDPMSGFMAFRRTLVDGVQLDPVGYKIGLEILARCVPRQVLEIPIEFRNRAFGTSKLDWKQQLLYIEHLRRLYQVRWPRLGRLASFGLVGAAGTVVNLLTVTLLVELVLGASRAAVLLSEALAFAVAVSFNFVLNRSLTFRDRRPRTSGPTSVLFVLVCLAGLVVNLVTLDLLLRWTTLHYVPATLAGILAGYLVNYVGASKLVFTAGAPDAAGS